jgi:Domain of unknown function (DUF4333)
VGRLCANRTVRGVIVAALALVLLGGCSASVSVGTGSGQLDTDKAEESVRTLLEGVPVDSVSCPDRDLKEGDVFECTAEVDGQAARVEVTQKDDEGNVHLERVDAILDVAKAVAFIEAQVLESSGSAVEADCGAQAYLVREPGSEVPCEITPTSGGPSSGVILGVKDVEGTVNLREA